MPSPGSYIDARIELPLNGKVAVPITLLSRVFGLSRLFGKKPDDRAAVRPLWHRVVGVAREREWYADCGVADTVPGRFDAVTMVLALVLLRLERDPAMAVPGVRLTELFVEDMDGQMRQSGVGDLVVGKKIGTLMSVLGGRLGALREALPQGVEAVAEAVTRNVTLIEGAGPGKVAERLLALNAQLAALPVDALLKGEIAR